MNTILSNRARTVVGFARVLAASVGQRDMEAAHLVAAILHEGQNPIVGAFHSAGVELHKLQRDLGSLLHHCEALPDADFAISQSPGEERLLAAAANQSGLRKSPVIWVDHLYFGAVECAEPPLLHILAKHGLSLERVEEHLQLIRPPQ